VFCNQNIFAQTDHCYPEGPFWQVQFIHTKPKWEIGSTAIFIAVICVLYFLMKKYKKKKNILAGIKNDVVVHTESRKLNL
jgi:hypothetical protein